MSRRVNDAARTLIKSFEGLKLKAYRDPGGVWTVGWGHTRNASRGMRISREQAQDLFETDLAEASGAVADLVSVDLNDNEFGALVSFVFNVGRGNFASSTLLKKINRGDRFGAADEFPRWRFQKKKELPGLVRRRAAERKLFLLKTEEGAEVLADGVRDTKQPDPPQKSKRVGASVLAGLSLAAIVAQGLGGDVTEADIHNLADLGMAAVQAVTAAGAALLAIWSKVKEGRS